MAFNRTLANQRILSDHVLQVVKALEGDANLGQPIKLTALSDAANFALDVRNLSTGGALRVKNIAGTVLFQVNETGLTLGPAVTRLIPGATSFAVRDNANANDNLLVSDAGDVTVRGRVLLATAVGKVVPGATSISFRNTADTNDNLIITDVGGVTIRSSATVNGILSSSSLVLITAVSQIVPGVTSLSLRNNANSVDNVLITDAGLVTLRNDLLFPPGATAMVAGFVHIPAAAGIPSGTPTNANSGRSPLYYDTTTKKLWVYDGITTTWKGVLVA